MLETALCWDCQGVKSAHVATKSRSETSDLDTTMEFG